MRPPDWPVALWRHNRSGLYPQPFSTGPIVCVYVLLRWCAASLYAQNLHNHQLSQSAPWFKAPVFQGCPMREVTVQFHIGIISILHDSFFTLYILSSFPPVSFSIDLCIIHWNLLDSICSNIRRIWVSFLRIQGILICMQIGIHPGSDDGVKNVLQPFSRVLRFFYLLTFKRISRKIITFLPLIITPKKTQTFYFSCPHDQ